MQACGRFVEQVEDVGILRTEHMTGKFEALALPAAEGVDALAQLKVAKSQALEQVQLGCGFGAVKQYQGLFDGDLQEFTDSVVRDPYLQCVLVIALPVTGVTRHPHIAHKVEAGFELAVTTTGGATSVYSR